MNTNMRCILRWTEHSEVVVLVETPTPGERWVRVRRAGRSTIDRVPRARLAPFYPIHPQLKGGL